jgi:hypothetical protein
MVGDSPRCGEGLGGLLHLLQPRAEIQQRDPIALCDQAALADLQRDTALGHLDAHALAPGVAEGDGPVVDLERGADHVDEFRLVGGGHDHEAGQVREIGDVVAARVGRAVRAHQPRTVDGEADGQALDRDVMHHLVVTALQEGRIDRGRRASGHRRPCPRTS